ncbi:hypothetical protein QY887_02480 [Latilactobacillus sakei]
MRAQPVILAIDQLTLEASDFQSLNSGLPFTIDAATSYQFFLKTPVDAPLDKRIQATQQQLTSYLQEQLITIAKTPMTLTRLESLTETEQQQTFGRLIREDEPLTPLALKMVRYDYQDLSEQLHDYQWLAFDQIIARQSTMDAVIASTSLQLFNAARFPQS